jgi:alcohol dehydrogenase (cytochrome c)
VALEKTTGRVVWDRAVADYKLGYRYTSGPIVVRGRVVAGMTGCDRYKNDVCFISAHNPDTGAEVWRTATIARPGEPGGDTWGELPLLFRAGGDAWIPGSYDAGTDLIYWSVAQAKPWARVSRGTDGAALYTNSVLALDPGTGRIVWHHQILPGETHDMDEVFENILIDRPGRRSLFKMGKLGILWEIERTKGTFVAAHDLGYQTIVDVDKASGAVSYRPGMIPQEGVPLEFCPGLGGVRTWRAIAYHPETEALYIPVSLSCQRSIFRKVPQVEGGAGSSVRPFAGEETVATIPHPKSPDARGQFIAMSIADGRILWRDVARRGYSTAALTTGGGLAFVGDGDGNVNAYDVDDGSLHFQTKLPFVGSGFPITFVAGGRQHIAFPAAPDGPGVAVFALPVAAR